MGLPPRPPHTRMVRYWCRRRLFQVMCFPFAPWFGLKEASAFQATPSTIGYRGHQFIR
jgi:hypothetical protein